MSWGRARMILGILLVISGFARASLLSNSRRDNDLPGIGWQGGLLLLPIVIGAALMWWGRRLSLVYLFALVIVLGGLAVALWGPSWGCVPDQPGEVCYLVGYSLPGIWLATVVASGVALGVAVFMVERKVGRSRSN